MLESVMVSGRFNITRKQLESWKRKTGVYFAVTVNCGTYSSYGRNKIYTRNFGLLHGESNARKKRAKSHQSQGWMRIWVPKAVLKDVQTMKGDRFLFNISKSFRSLGPSTSLFVSTELTGHPKPLPNRVYEYKDGLVWIERMYKDSRLLNRVIE